MTVENVSAAVRPRHKNRIKDTDRFVFMYYYKYITDITLLSRVLFLYGHTYKRR